MRFETIPRRRLYPIAGLFLALGAPGGLLILRALVRDRVTDVAWLANELSSRALTYGYVAFSTAILFVGLGIIIGSHEDLLERMSLSDTVTGLPNRRLFERRLREELARVDRYHQPLALMLMDLDGLKGINDQFGHEAGDQAIRAVARSLLRTCRSTDLAARYGGDEFTVLAPNITEGEAEKLAERIRRTLETEASWVTVALPSLTVSIGVADTRCIEELHPDRLFAAADQAMYQAKQQGGDRVVLASPLPASTAEPVPENEAQNA